MISIKINQLQNLPCIYYQYDYAQQYTHISYNISDKSG